eukprot:TRINITY_DN49932_c0_g1_i1.p1 TRINITY_DN49932_c0_g1~~TRINITY_DN49932_c0_g1_i1.p1  ORF type:complete len:343 (+),score=106.81 TRINITY_DN49932_c0_g1_i1:87-1115(+)
MRVLSLLAAAGAAAGFQLRGSLRAEDLAEAETFSVAWKAGAPPGTANPGGSWPSGQEVTVMERHCPQMWPHVCHMTHFWCGGSWANFENNVLRYYVDGERRASVMIPFGLGHGSYWLADDPPWDAGGLFGRTGEPSGIWNNFVIPFGHSLRVTVELTASESFWIILKGIQRPSLGGISIGQYELPAGARARTHVTPLQAVADGARIPVVPYRVPEGPHHKMVLYTSLAVNYTADYPTHFLEGCYRNEGQDGISLLSSGTEDYFLGTYYFNKGKYQNPIAGVTAFKESRFSAYRVHGAADPLVLKGNRSVTWRNDDPSGCDLSAKGPSGHTIEAAAFSFFYEW